MFSTVDLEKELFQERNRQEQLLDSANKMLRDEAARDGEIRQRLNGDGSGKSISLIPDDEERIFTIEQIRSICIRYRLRFLDSKYFKAEFPYEAVSKIKAFENRYEVRIETFRIVAPDRLFDLENINKDPLLFAELSDGRYYLIHKWGNDMKWTRSLLAWPLQSFKTFFISLWAVCFLGSFLLPTSLLNVLNLESEIYLRLWFTVHLFIGLSGISLWLAFSYDKRFSDMNWNSKYYNF